MDRALSLVENVEFVRRRLYKDSVESENYARGLREELGLEKLKRPQKANAALEIINQGVMSVCDAVADKIIRGEK